MAFFSGDLHRILALEGLEHFDKYYSFYHATVFDNKDPNNQNRIKVKSLELYGDITIPQWVEPLINHTTDSTYIISPPKKDSEVWLVFLKGNLQKPMWLPKTQSNNINDLKNKINKYNLSQNDLESYCSFIQDVLLTVVGSDITLNTKGVFTIKNDSDMPSANFNGDKLRKELSDIVDLVGKVNNIIDNLSNALLTYNTGVTSAISPIAPPFAVVSGALVQSITTIKAAVSEVALKINTIDIEGTKSKTLNNT